MLKYEIKKVKDQRNNVTGREQQNVENVYQKFSESRERNAMKSKRIGKLIILFFRRIVHNNNHQ
jgi:hypothetical protein